MTPPGPPPGTNAFAIVSLVLSLCGGGVLGLIFGIIALVQIKRTGQKGRGLAIAGVSVSAVYLTAIVIAVTVGILNGANRDGTGQITGSGSVSLESLKPGDCLDDVPTGLTSRVDAVPCSQPHHGEVFAIFSLTGTSYPGDSEVESLSEDGCVSRLRTYSVSATTDEDLTLLYFAPTRANWLRSKTTICVAVDETRQRTGSIKD